MARIAPSILSFRESIVFYLYVVLFLMLASSTLIESDGGNAGYLLTYFVTLVIAYFVFKFAVERRAENWFSKNYAVNPNKIADALFVASILVVIAHFIYLGQIPLVSASTSNDYFGVMRIRQAIFFDAPAVYRYLPNFVLKSLLPILTLYYYVSGSRFRFFLSTVMGMFYGLALLNKIFVLIPFVPLMLYLLLNRRFVRAILCGAIMAAGLAVLVFVQNPQVRPSFWTSPDQVTMSGEPLYVESAPVPKERRSATFPAFQFVDTIYLRLFVVPGQVVSAWFADIPEKIPYGHGCGYRLVAKLKGCDFRFYPSLVHDIENPVLVAQGVHGTMTAASFMEDYANFGGKGMVLGGVLLGFVLAAVSAVFAGQWRWALILNCIPIGLLIELPLSTVLLTGGWALTIIVYLLLRPGLARAENAKIEGN
ncbi:hypothetical protein [Pandoraea sp. 64-18]|uniref:hypothetical protein n=1 Tax=Pandoraea sp. 64-18 TaxID=1895806 RepID=UPI000A8214B6|nr:hypothetical protein [Pandoraea sp. 64-18]